MGRGSDASTAATPAGKTLANYEGLKGALIGRDLAGPRMTTSTVTLITHDTPEGLRRCQVETPYRLVQRVWEMALDLRTDFHRVLDLGAGDGRFATAGDYREYVGIEIDANRKAHPAIPDRAVILHQCASMAPDSFDLAIGNPPYTRHQDIDPKWREQVRDQIQRTTGKEVSRFGNLYLYFMWLSLLKTKDNGLIALIVPFEWVCRPSAASLRAYLSDNRYQADVYRLPDDNEMFPGVKTTASITVIDKAAGAHSIRCHTMDGGLRDVELDGSQVNVLPYEDAKDARAFRGFSTGSQDVFLLTDKERRAAGLRMDEVVPCVASLRSLPDKLTTLNQAAFQNQYVAGDRKCWLLRTDGTLSPAMKKHLDSAPDEVKENWTCSHREPWYTYSLPPVPDLIYASGFRGRSPRVLVNSAQVRIVGATHGIAVHRSQPLRKLRQAIADFDFGRAVVPHARGLQKVEVRQMNTVLNELAAKPGGTDGASR